MVCGVADAFDENLAQRIRERRQELGLSIRAAGDRLNAATGLAWPPTRWGKVEAEGRRINVLELIGIAAALETTPMELLDDDTARRLCDRQAEAVNPEDEQRIRNARLEKSLRRQIARSINHTIQGVIEVDDEITEDEVDEIAYELFMRSLIAEREARVADAVRMWTDTETLDVVQLRGWATRRIADDVWKAWMERD